MPHAATPRRVRVHPSAPRRCPTTRSHPSVPRRCFRPVRQGAGLNTTMLLITTARAVAEGRQRQKSRRPRMRCQPIADVGHEAKNDIGAGLDRKNSTMRAGPYPTSSPYVTAADHVCYGESTVFRELRRLEPGSLSLMTPAARPRVIMASAPKQTSTAAGIETPGSRLWVSRVRRPLGQRRPAHGHGEFQITSD